jgi:hypothetical protein
VRQCAVILSEECHRSNDGCADFIFVPSIYVRLFVAYKVAVNLAYKVRLCDEICALRVAKDCVRAVWYGDVVKGRVQLVEVGVERYCEDFDEKSTNLLSLVFWWLSL